MTSKKLRIANLFFMIFLIYLLTTAPAHTAVWEAPYPLDTFFDLVDFKYDYDPSINKVTMTYQYRNNIGSTIYKPRIVNLFLWSNDICSILWETMGYNGSGVFTNLDQSATVVDPDGYFNWHSLITSPTPPLGSSGMFPSLPTQNTQESVLYPFWNICTITPGEWVSNEIATFSTSWTVSNAYWVQSASWIVHCEGEDCPAFPDFDGDSDGITDCADNCPETPNGPDLGMCINCSDGTIGPSCTVDGQCSGGLCSLNQGDCDKDTIGDVCDVAEDNYPPNGNGCIDVCECEGDVHGVLGEGYPDGDVDGSDAFVFKSHFGRNASNRPCTSGDPCYRDFECDGDVDGTDAFKFKTDFGRSYCPPCTFSCSY